MECFYRFVSQNKQLFFSLFSTDQLVCETGPQTFLELGIEYLCTAYLNDITSARSSSHEKAFWFVMSVRPSVRLYQRGCL